MGRIETKRTVERRVQAVRLDKFLKVSRLIKRRTLAKEVADQGRITINGFEGKASSNVKIGDVLTIRFGQKLVTVQIESIQETSRKNEATELYSVVKEEKLSNQDIL
jgi:ribosomal 50S subunit-recycling heat shock protein